MARLVLVHGSVQNGPATWARQRELADVAELVVLNRPGFPPGPLVARVDFEADANWVAEQLRPGDHLCGHSYGGVIALFAAAGAPAGLASLTVVEPPAFGLAAGDPATDALVERIEAHASAGSDDPRAYLAGFMEIVTGRRVVLPDPLPPDLEQGARLLPIERPPTEARPPLAALRALPCPKLVVSGGWSPAFERVCDVLAEAIDARREILPGARHAVQAAPGFDELLRAVLTDTR